MNVVLIVLVWGEGVLTWPVWWGKSCGPHHIHWPLSFPTGCGTQCKHFREKKLSRSIFQFTSWKASQLLLCLKIYLQAVCMHTSTVTQLSGVTSCNRLFCYFLQLVMQKFVSFICTIIRCMLRQLVRPDPGSRVTSSDVGNASLLTTPDARIPDKRYFRNWWKFDADVDGSYGSETLIRCWIITIPHTEVLKDREHVYGRKSLLHDETASPPSTFLLCWFS